jgi:RNA polymerase sigma-70 factor, ECF subfamily
MSLKAETGSRQDGADVWKAEILAIAACGDEAAFARLFRHFAPRIKAFVQRAGLAPDAAEEIAQETLAAAWRKAALFDPARTPTAAAWLYAIARNLRIDRHRREKRPEPDPNDPAYAPDPPAAPDAAAQAGREAERVAKAIATLPAAQREALMLSFYEDEPHSSIAVRLGLPLGTVKSRLRLALARLREALGEGA